MSDAPLSIAALTAAFRSRALSPAEVLSETYARLDVVNPMLNAVSHEDRDAATTAARASEARWAKGEPAGPLDGVLFSVKSNLLKQGWPARRGSRQIDAAPAAFDAPAVRALERAGAIAFCQTTMPEFGWKGLGDSPLTGATRNPWDASRTSGGSSAGAAALAAHGVGAIHLGTDGLGSIRIPASFCGVFGIKPSFGRVPAFPASPFGVLAHVGPLTRTVADAALALAVLATPDDRDFLAWNVAPPDYVAGLERSLRGVRIAWAPTLGGETRIDPDVARLTADAAASFAALGATVEEAGPAFTTADALGPANALWQAGAASLLDLIPPERRAEVDPGFVRAGEAGLRLSALDLVRAYARRAALAETLRAFHERFDLLLTPTMPIPAPALGRDTPVDGGFGEDWVAWSPFTYPFNLSGAPAASIPCGMTRSGLPVGLQIVGRLREDALVLAAAHAFERSRPPLAVPSAGTPPPQRG